MKISLAQKNHERVCDMGRKTLSSWANKRIKLTATELSTIIDDYFVGAFYINRPLAESLAALFVLMTKNDTEFEDMYIRSKTHIDNNQKCLGYDPFSKIDELTISIDDFR